MTASPIENSAAEYVDPVRQLLGIGKDPGRFGREWSDYPAEHGLDLGDVEELVRMVGDPALYEPDANSQRLWASRHAWRALGQLRAERAVAPLLHFLAAHDEDDYAAAELPTVFGLIGPAALGPLGDFVSVPEITPNAAGIAMAALAKIGVQHPDCRDACIAVLARTLQGDDREANSSAVASLLDLKGVEAIEPIREAFGRDAVDETMAGDLEDVEIALGLRQSRSTPRPHYLMKKYPALERLASLLAERRAPPTRAKVGRNDPCPCGSGKKYKKCCLGKVGLDAVLGA